MHSTVLEACRRCRRPLLHAAAAATRACRFKGLFWKFARVGERLSPWISVACFCMAFSVVFF